MLLSFCAAKSCWSFLWWSHWAPLYSNTSSKAGICWGYSLPVALGAVSVTRNKKLKLPQTILCCSEMADQIYYTVTHVIHQLIANETLKHNAWSSSKNCKSSHSEIVDNVCITGRPLSTARPAQRLWGDSGLFGHGQLRHSPYPFTQSLYDSCLWCELTQRASRVCIN